MRNIVAPSNYDGIVTRTGRPAWLEAVENNWYEGSRWSPNRSYIWFPVQDARKDLDRFTRLELSRHARYLWKNSPFIRGLIERLVTLTVGSGYHCVFRSSNPAWNARATEVLKKRCRNISLGPRATFHQYQRAVARARFVDGECFSVKTVNQVTWEERMQGIEAERVGGIRKSSEVQSSPENLEFNHDYQGGVDGFNIDAQGNVRSYNIRGVDKPYDAQYVIHHFTPSRLGQYRGETILSSSINTARDVDDILALEKASVKSASSNKDIIETATGQIDPETIRKLRYGQNYPTVFNLPPDDNTKSDYYRVHFQSEPVVLKSGDKYTPYKPDRPGPAWQGFMDFLAQTMCLSSGLPPSVLGLGDPGGTDIRRDLDIAQRVVDPWQEDLGYEFSEIVEYILSGEITDGKLRADCPDDWDNIVWFFPPKLNVDRQQAQQDRNDVAQGLMSTEEYHARYGDDADVVEASIVAAAKKRKQAIKDAGFESILEFVQVISLAPQVFQAKQDEKPEPAQTA